MLFTALLSFMVSIASYAIDPAAGVGPFFSTIGVIAAVLYAVGLVVALLFPQSQDRQLGERAHA